MGARGAGSDHFRKFATFHAELRLRKLGQDFRRHSPVATEPLTKTLIYKKMASSTSSGPAGLINVHKALQKKEKTPTFVFRTAADANLYVATQIKELILNSKKKPVVLGLATGSTPVGT